MAIDQTFKGPGRRSNFREVIIIIASDYKYGFWRFIIVIYLLLYLVVMVNKMQNRQQMRLRIVADS